MLGTIQSSHVGSGGVKPASTTTSAKVDKDLRRVLAHSEEEKLSTSDSKSKRIKKGSAVATCESSNESSRQRRGDKVGNGSKQIEAS